MSPLAEIIPLAYYLPAFRLSVPQCSASYYQGNIIRVIIPHQSDGQKSHFPTIAWDAGKHPSLHNAASPNSQPELFPDFLYSSCFCCSPSPPTGAKHPGPSLLLFSASRELCPRPPTLPALRSPSHKAHLGFCPLWSLLWLSSWARCSLSCTVFLDLPFSPSSDKKTP